MGKLNLTMCWQYGIDSSTLAFEIIWARNGSWTLLSTLVLHVFKSLTCQTDAHELQKCINCLIWRSYNRLLFCHSLYVDGDIVGRSACRYHLFHQSSDPVYLVYYIQVLFPTDGFIMATMVYILQYSWWWANGMSWRICNEPRSAPHRKHGCNHESGNAKQADGVYMPLRKISCKVEMSTLLLL